MDGIRFDDATRRWGDGSRRTALRLAAGSAVALLVAPLGRDQAIAKKKKCKHGKKRCQGTCIPKTDCCAAADCPAGTGQTCQAGTCGCPEGQFKSGGVCGTPPPITCWLTDVPCNADGDCCNQHCAAGGTGGKVCVCATPGDVCLTIADCCLGLDCIGFVCKEA